jgi:hypothetical protein
VETTKAKRATKRELIVVTAMISRMIGTSVFSDGTEFSLTTPLMCLKFKRTFRFMPFRLPFKYFMIVAMSTALAVAAVMYGIPFSRQWDNPPSEMLGNSGTIMYSGRSVAVTVSCNCPKVLTESIHRSVPVRVDLKSEIGALPPEFLDSKTHDEEIVLVLGAGGAVLEPSKIRMGSARQLLSGNPLSASFVLTITATDTTLSQITFDFVSGEKGSLGSVAWQLAAHPRFTTFVMPFVYGLLVLGLIAATFYVTLRRVTVLRERTEKKLADADRQMAANPERIKFAWDVARVKLEAYFDRNLIQVNLVFWVAVFVMAVGFGFVLFGVVLSLNQPKVTSASLVAAISGIITQFIGATFMVIYRSTMAQANEFMSVLDRINSVGMAIQVLDSIPESEGQLKNATRAQIVELLIAAPSDRSRPRPRKTTIDKKTAASSTGD